MEAPKKNQTYTIESPFACWACCQSMAGSVIFVQLPAWVEQLAKYVVHAHWYTLGVEFKLVFQQGVTSPISGVAGKLGTVLQLTPPRATNWSKKLSPESILQGSVSLIRDIRGFFWANHKPCETTNKKGEAYGVPNNYPESEKTHHVCWANNVLIPVYSTQNVHASVFNRGFVQWLVQYFFWMKRWEVMLQPPCTTEKSSPDQNLRRVSS